MLGLVVAEYMFTLYPDQDEGWLSRARSALVRSSALAQMANELQLGDALLLGKGEDATGGRAKASILADALEAVIGAIYLDGGWAPARTFVLGLVRDRLDALVEAPACPTPRAGSRSWPAATCTPRSATTWPRSAPSTTRPSPPVAWWAVGCSAAARAARRRRPSRSPPTRRCSPSPTEPDGLRAAAPRTQSEDPDA